MTSGPMTLEDFQHLLDAYGGDLGLWPAPQQAAAKALLADSPQARERLGDACAMDAALRGGAPKAPPALVDRILKAASAADRTAKPVGVTDPASKKVRRSAP